MFCVTIVKVYIESLLVSVSDLCQLSSCDSVLFSTECESKTVSVATHPTIVFAQSAAPPTELLSTMSDSRDEDAASCCGCLTFCSLMAPCLPCLAFGIMGKACEWCCFKRTQELAGISCCHACIFQAMFYGECVQARLESKPENCKEIQQGQQAFRWLCCCPCEWTKVRSSYECSCYPWYLARKCCCPISLTSNTSLPPARETMESNEANMAITF